MAITLARNHGVFGSAAGSATLDFPALTFRVGTGRVLIMCGVWSSGLVTADTITVQSGTDPGDLNWFIVPAGGANATSSFIALTLCPTGVPIGVVFRVTFSSSIGTRRIGLSEWSGLGDPNVTLEDAQAATSVVSGDPSVSVANTSANALIIAALGMQNATTFTPNATYTELHDNSGGSRTLGGVYRIVTSATTYTPGANAATNNQWAAVAFAIGEDPAPTCVTPVMTYPNTGGVSVDYAITTLGGTVTEVAFGGKNTVRINRTGTTRVDATAVGPWAQRIYSGFFWLRAASLPTAQIAVFQIPYNTGNNIEIRLDNTGALRTGRQGGASSASASATTIAVGTWYRISFWVDTSTGTVSVDTAVDNDTPVGQTWAQAAETPAEWVLGSRLVTTASLYDLYYAEGEAYDCWYTVPASGYNEAGGARSVGAAGGTATTASAESGGARSAARAGGSETTAFPRAGGARSSARGGAVATLASPDAGGARSTARAGGVATIAQSDAGGARSEARAGGAATTANAEAGGGRSSLRGGGAATTAQVEAGGARSEARAGAATSTARPEQGGARSEARAGGVATVGQADSGGARSEARAGGVATSAQVEAGGARSEGRGGASAATARPEEGGARSELRAGGTATGSGEEEGGARTDARGGADASVAHSEAGGGQTPLEGGGAAQTAYGAAGGARTDSRAGGSASVAGGTAYSEAGGARSELRGGGASTSTHPATGGGRSELEGGEQGTTPPPPSGGGGGGMPNAADAAARARMGDRTTRTRGNQEVSSDGRPVASPPMRRFIRVSGGGVSLLRGGGTHETHAEEFDPDEAILVLLGLV